MRGFQFCVLLATCSFSLNGGAVEVGIEVREPSAVRRAGEIVTVGVPLARNAGVRDAAMLSVLDGDTEIPSQHRVLSRWGGEADCSDCAIRWVLMVFRLDLEPSESRRLRVVSNETPRQYDSPLQAATEPDAIVIDTGRMNVRISRLRGNVFDRIAVGDEVVAEDTTPGRSRSGARLVGSDKEAYRAGFASAPVVSIEEQGPVRVIVRVVSDLADVEGRRVTPGDMRVVHRVECYANSTLVRFRTWLENNAPYGDAAAYPENVVYLDSFGVDIPLVLEGETAFQTQELSGAGNADDAWEVYQRHDLVDPTDESENFSYRVEKNGEMLGAGARHEGWLSLSGQGRSVTAGMRWFWQNYEKAMSISGHLLSLEFWPAEGVYPPQRDDLYQFEGGRHKGYEAYLDFGAMTAGSLEAFGARLAKPVVAVLAPGDYFRSGAMGMTDPRSLVFSGTYDDARMNSAYARYNALMRKRGDGIAPDGGRYVNNLAEAREARFVIGDWATADWYGWAHFGDCAWGDGYSSNHYDLPGFLLLHFLRTGDRALFDLVEPHVRQASEWGQVWGIDSNPCLASISFYEKVSHGLAQDWYRTAPSHNWVRRLVYYHWLTGDEAAREAAVFNGEALIRYWGACFDASNPASMDTGVNDWSPLNESRHLTWSIDNALALFDMTGEARWTGLAEDLVPCVLYAYARDGHINGYGEPVLGRCLMTHYGVEPLIRFHAESDNAPLKAQVLDMLRGIVAGTYEANRVQASGSGVNYRPEAIVGDWDWGREGPENYDAIYNGFAASAYAYVGWLDGNDEYMNIAHRLWSDGVYYPEYAAAYPARDYREYGKWDSWGWASLTYPGSDEKVFARETREGIPYLWVMAQVLDAGAGEGEGEGEGEDRPFSCSHSRRVGGTKTGPRFPAGDAIVLTLAVACVVGRSRNSSSKRGPRDVV